VEYVNRNLKTPPNDPDVAILCSTLQFYPLAFSQAVAYIRHQQRISLQGYSYSVRHYLAEYESKGELVLNTAPTISTYEQTSFVVLNITIDKMKSYHERVGSVAYSCLELFSVLNPDGIDVSFLDYFLKRIINYRSHATASEVSVDEITSAVQLLVLYSLISVQKCVATIRRVVQKVARLRIKEVQQPKNAISSVLRYLLPKKKNVVEREVELLEAILPAVQEKIEQISKSEMVQILSIMYHTLNHLSLVAQYCNLPYEVTTRLHDLYLGEEMLAFSTKYYLALKNTVGEKFVNTIAMKLEIGRSLWFLSR